MDTISVELIAIRCSKCNLCKPVSEFHFRKETGNYRSSCVACKNSRNRELHKFRRENGVTSRKLSVLGTLSAGEAIAMCSEKTTSEIAHIAGKSYYDTHNFLNRRGAKAQKEKVRRRTSGKLSPQEIVSLSATHTARELAELDGTSRGVVCSFLRSRHILPNTEKVCNPERHKLSFGKSGTHGFTTEAKSLSLSAGKYYRLLALLQLGAKCACCDNIDLRVLEINHVNRDAPRSISKRTGLSVVKSDSLVSDWKRAALLMPPDRILDIRCGNCNLYHEIDSGAKPRHSDTAITAFMTWIKDFDLSVAKKYSDGRVLSGLCTVARSVGYDPNRAVRLAAILRKGASCARCKNSDVNVLCFNHIFGKRPKNTPTGRRDISAEHREYIAIAMGETVEHIEVLCRNCNILHEYERGARRELFDYELDVAKERVLKVQVYKLMRDLIANGTLSA